MNQGRELQQAVPEAAWTSLYVTQDLSQIEGAAPRETEILKEKLEQGKHKRLAPQYWSLILLVNSKKEKRLKC